MHVILTILHISACIFLVLVVLLQTGKGAEMGAVFGGSSSTVFGSSGAGNFLTRLTTVTAVLFMLTSLGLTFLGSRQGTATIFDTAPAAQPLSSGDSQPIPPVGEAPRAEDPPPPVENSAPVANPQNAEAPAAPNPAPAQ